MNDIKRWSFAGFITISILGALLHYVFSWTGHSKITGFFVPVNESVWEHLKLGYWAVALFSVIEYPFVRRQVNNYFLAKTTGVLILEMTILAVFYGYMAISGKDMLWLDISSYFLGAALCQYLAYKMIRLNPLPVQLNRLGIAVFIAIGILFGVTTYYPPHTGLFRDNMNCTFGIHEEK